MKRTLSSSFENSPVRTDYPTHVPDNKELLTSMDGMPIDLLDNSDMEKFVQLCVTDFTKMNSGDDGYIEPHVMQYLSDFVQYKTFPDGVEQLGHLACCLLEHLPALVVPLFKISRLTFLHMEAPNDKILLALIDLLDKISGVEQVHFYDPSVTPEMLGKFIASNHNIPGFSNWGNIFDGRSAKFLADALLGNPTIKYLEFAIGKVFSPDEVDFFLESIEKIKSIEEIGIYVSEADKSDFIGIVRLINRSTTLKKFTIDNNGISDEIYFMFLDEIKINKVIFCLNLDDYLENLSIDVLERLVEVLNQNECLVEFADSESCNWAELFSCAAGSSPRFKLLENVKNLLDRNKYYALHRVAAYANGATAGLFDQFGIPPEVAFIIRDSLTMPEACNLTSVNRNALVNAQKLWEKTAHPN